MLTFDEFVSKVLEQWLKISFIFRSHWELVRYTARAGFALFTVACMIMVFVTPTITIAFWV